MAARSPEEVAGRMENGELVIQGRTVKEAVLTARKLLQVAEWRLKVEVLEEGRRGFMGLFARPATIRVVLRPGGRASQDRAHEPDREGMAEVSGGMLHVYNPRGQGRAAVVIPVPGVVLRVNGVAVHGSRPLREDDEIEIEPLEEVRPAGVEVEVSADGFTARAKVTPQVTVRYELVDQNPQSVLQLLTRRHEERAKLITAAEVEATLRAKGVNFGLDQAEMQRAVAAADGVARVVARGEPVREGRDGLVEYLFHREPLEVVYDEEEKVDYWERYIFPSVKEGEVLAVVHLPVPGTPGRKVTGELVMPAAVREASLRVKDGVVISDDGRKAVAAIAGRPVLEGFREPCLKIVQMMVHSGDVDIRSGNLSFGGDLLILGNVTEEMRVAAHGEITVMGNVTGAEVHAGGQVVCRGKVIGSQVRAGGLKAFYNRLAPVLDDLGRVLDEVVGETTRIKEHPGYHERLKKGDLNRIMKFLLERKRPEIDALAGKYAAALEGIDLPLPPAVRELALGIRDLASAPVVRAAASADELESIRQKKEEIHRLLDSLPDQPGDILCSYAQTSTLESSGNIIVAEEGCYHSTLTAGKQVRVHGVFRGGEIFAMGDVFVSEAGSPGLSAGKVKIRVAGEATVSFRKVYPETTVQVGSRSRDFDEEMERVKLYLGSKGTLQIGNLGE